MQTECSPYLFEFEAVGERRVEARFDGGEITSDAGALLLGRLDRDLGLLGRFAACFRDRRDPALREHEVETLVGQRVIGIALGYEDLIDHDELRHDRVFHVLAGKLTAWRSDCAPVAGKSTLNRLEHGGRGGKYHKIDHDPGQIKSVFVEHFVGQHGQPPQRIVLDLDVTDDPVHGGQDGGWFQAHYDCHCYLPLYVFCGDHLLAAQLRPGDAGPSAGALEEVQRIVGQLRGAWPRVQITLRGDSAFSTDELMGWCEDNGVDYVFGLARNSRLEAVLGPAMGRAAARCAASGAAAREFEDFAYSPR